MLRAPSVLIICLMLLGQCQPVFLTLRTCEVPPRQTPRTKILLMKVFGGGKDFEKFRLPIAACPLSRLDMVEKEGDPKANALSTLTLVLKDYVSDSDN